MKKMALLITAFIFMATANAQLTYGKRTGVKDAHDKYTNMDTTLQLPEGTKLKNGKITLTNGYGTVYIDSNQVILVQKPNGETTGAFRCGCISDSGNHRVTFTGKEIHCIAGCSIDVTLGNHRNISQPGSEWKTIILSSDNIKKQKAGN